MTPAVIPNQFVEVNGLRLYDLDWGSHGAPVIASVHGLTSHAHAFAPPPLGIGRSRVATPCAMSCRRGAPPAPSRS